MNCLQVQSKITSYIEENLEEDELLEFIQHVEHCPECKEELEVYYTLIVGMKQLDNNEVLSDDFSQELNQKLAEESERIRSRRRWLFQIKMVVITLMCIITMFTVFQTGQLIAHIRNKESQRPTPNYVFVKLRLEQFRVPGSTPRIPYRYFPE